ncbi:MOSC N-terminal beta barrel domain-containing protein [Streptomyces sp. NPDC002677]|uniref:MOSC N-terminal beta barrel domain-containing protein n=1 Tax=Streptomyces sp. NPDC002677 TaxID=3154774 RepID=UPI003326E98B
MGVAEPRSTHVHPVRTLRGLSPRQTVVEPWGPAGDRRRALIDDGGKVVTRRAQPRLASAAAELLSGGGVRLPAPGQAPPEVPEPVAVVSAGVHGTQVHGTQEEAVPPVLATHAWCDDQLGTDTRHVRTGPGRPRRPACRRRARPPLPPRRPIGPAHAPPGETVCLSDGRPLLITAQAPLDARDSFMARDDHADAGPLPVDLPGAGSDFDSSDLRPRGNPRQRPGR